MQCKQSKKCETPAQEGRTLCAEHLEKRRTYQREYSQRVGRDAIRATRLRSFYGITVDEYNEMLERQGGKCAICGQTENYYKGGTKCALSVDHDHETGKVRGLLCNHCNRGVGMLRDNPALLRRAADYLEEA